MVALYQAIDIILPRINILCLRADLWFWADRRAFNSSSRGTGNDVDATRPYRRFNSQSLKPNFQDYITADEMKLFARDNETPWQYLCRHLGKYHEHINCRSTVRKTPQRKKILTGASIAVRLRDHLFCPKPPQKGSKTSKTAAFPDAFKTDGETLQTIEGRGVPSEWGPLTPPSPALSDGVKKRNERSPQKLHLRISPHKKAIVLKNKYY
jgi:hypothetical protein